MIAVENRLYSDKLKLQNSKALTVTHEPKIEVTVHNESGRIGSLDAFYPGPLCLA
jgi:hypothetical protein